ncbi:uncharacterized protein CCOS01_06787 [Colletotrichum costaricense]|uniref:Secreted protein n=1 Tax=Colletotrichum costaricense TaxID=1209916 RepID=A0AAI9YZ59_9PEZI|nr:uncharacterized protein CCOS01_06787 [Colletotrichum costaricense]KAK1528953.1 hypothetical protein CCOS01_06787 [Colletotrichum costaricense]
MLYPTVVLALELSVAIHSTISASLSAGSDNEDEDEDEDGDKCKCKCKCKCEDRAGRLCISSLAPTLHTMPGQISVYEYRAHLQQAHWERPDLNPAWH